MLSFASINCVILFPSPPKENSHGCGTKQHHRPCPFRVAVIACRCLRRRIRPGCFRRPGLSPASKNVYTSWGKSGHISGRASHRLRIQNDKQAYIRHQQQQRLIQETWPVHFRHSGVPLSDELPVLTRWLERLYPHRSGRIASPQDLPPLPHPDSRFAGQRMLRKALPRQGRLYPPQSVLEK